MLDLELISQAHIDAMIMVRPQKNWRRMANGSLYGATISWGSLAMTESHDPYARERAKERQGGKRTTDAWNCYSRPGQAVYIHKYKTVEKGILHARRGKGKVSGGKMTSDV
jgi:hypothetical protein